MEKLRLHMSGMVCENSVKQVSRSLETIQGVRKVVVDTLARTTVVEHDEQVCAVDDLLEAVDLAGFQVERVDFERPDALDQEWRFARRPVVRGMSTGSIEWPKPRLHRMGA